MDAELRKRVETLLAQLNEAKRDCKNTVEEYKLKYISYRALKEAIKSEKYYILEDESLTPFEARKKIAELELQLLSQKKECREFRKEIKRKTKVCKAIQKQYDPLLSALIKSVSSEKESTFNENVSFRNF
jgi:hypothetical protein